MNFVDEFEWSFAGCDWNKAHDKECMKQGQDCMLQKKHYGFPLEFIYIKIYDLIYIKSKR